MGENPLFACCKRLFIKIIKEGKNLAKREDYEQMTETILAPIMEQNGFELVDVEFVKEGSTKYLRVDRKSVMLG